MFSVEMMLDMIKDHRLLYDKQHAQYKNIQLKDVVFDKIGVELGMTGTYAYTVRMLTHFPRVIVFVVAAVVCGCLRANGAEWVPRTKKS